MARCTYVWRNGEFVEKHGPLDIRPVKARSHLPAPMIILDTQDDILSHADGKMYSSKSAMRKAYKANGLVELGNDAPTKPAAHAGDRVTKTDLAAALNKVKQGYKPATRSGRSLNIGT